MRVSEVVTIKEINKWKDGDIITIAAGTGSGKSYFIKNNLYAIAKRDKKRILMLIHRVNCVNQFQMEIEDNKKTDVIDIMTYQAIDNLYARGSQFDFDQYDIICSDEFHYFLSDSSFNKYTDLSLEAILKQTNKLRIFMSATGDYMKQYINRFKKYQTIDYSVPIDFKFIKRLEFYHKDLSLDSYIQEAIELNKKAIFFIQSDKKAYELHSRYKEHTLFNCSKNNADYYKFVDPEKIESMLKKERFEELILITTTVMDAGVNIYDDELNHIVADVSDTGTLIQCIGRKRLKNKDDRITLHVKAMSGQRLGGLQTQANKRLNMVRFFNEYGEQAYVKKYYRQFDKTSIIYDDYQDNQLIKKRNDLMYFKTEIDILEIELIKDKGKEGYCKYISNLFDIEYNLLDEKETGDILRDYLDSLIGIRLDKQKQNELVEVIDLKVNGRQQRSYKKLNEGLEMINMPYVIIPKKSGDIRYWILEKIDR